MLVPSPKMCHAAGAPAGAAVPGGRTGELAVSPLLPFCAQKPFCKQKAGCLFVDTNLFVHRDLFVDTNLIVHRNLFVHSKLATFLCTETFLCTKHSRAGCSLFLLRRACALHCFVLQIPPCAPFRAQAAIERRKAAAFISGMHGGNAPEPPGKVRNDAYAGAAASSTASRLGAAVLAQRFWLALTYRCNAAYPSLPFLTPLCAGVSRTVRRPGCAAALRPRSSCHCSQRRGPHSCPGRPAGKRRSGGSGCGSKAERGRI